MRTEIKSVTSASDDSEGHSIFYHFNEAGNVISANDELWHAKCATYDSGIANTPSGEGRLQKTVINRLPNVDFDSGWTQVKEYSSDSYSWDVSQLCMNMPSAKISKRGAGEFRQQTTAKLFSSGNYTLSAFIKTTGL